MARRPLASTRARSARSARCRAFVPALALWLCAAAPAFAQQLYWASGTQGAAEGLSVATDAGRNVLASGRFRGSVTFGADEGNETTLLGEGLEDLFVAKYDRTGALLWVRRAGGSGATAEAATGVATDADGNVFVTGFFSGTATFGAGQPNETALTSGGSVDAFLAKYDEFGSLVWARRTASGRRLAMSAGLGVAVDAAGQAFVTGTFEERARFSAAGGDIVLTSAGSGDVFVAKYDGDGAALWARGAGSSASEAEAGTHVAVDAEGHAYVTGFFAGSATFGAGEPGQIALASAGSKDAFVVKYDGTGALLWAVRAGGTGLDQGAGIAADSDGNAYATGFFETSASFAAVSGAEASLLGAGSEDVFVAKYDAAGALLWARSAGGVGADEGGGIATDLAGNAYVTGFFEQTAVFGAQESNETALASAGARDVFAAKYDAAGALLWVTRAGGTGLDQGAAAATDRAGDPHVAGTFSGTAVFGSGEPHETRLDSNPRGLFVAVFAPDTPIGPPPPPPPPPPVFSLALAPEDAKPVVGSRHCTSALLRDASGTAAQGQVLHFSVSGSSALEAELLTDSGGQAQFCYTVSELPGADTLVVTADAANHPSRSAAISIALPRSTDRCRVRYIGRIVAGRGQPALLRGFAAVIRGSARGNHDYLDLGPARNLRIDSLNVEALTCQAGSASVFGQARARGGGTIPYRIDLRQGGPGRLGGRFRIRLSNGYDSGDASLRGGFVDVDR